MKSTINIDKQEMTVKKDLFTWSNLISLTRVFVSFPIIYLHHVHSGEIGWPVVLLVAYGIGSDYLDGYLARKLDEISELGKILDPVADKVTAVVLFVYTVVIGLIPLWFLVLVIVRDLLIVTGSILIYRKYDKVAMSVISGKFSVNALALYWISVFFFPEAVNVHLFFMGASVGLMIYSFFEYLQRFRSISKGAKFN